MRDIRFRAWDSSEEEMINWGKLIYDPDDWLLGILRGENNEDVLIQYTGLKDKNGKEIYEGDIIQQNYMNCKEELGFISCGETADDWLLQLVPDNIYGRFGHLSSAIDNDNAKVIGNIYSNPELLEKN